MIRKPSVFSIDVHKTDIASTFFYKKKPKVLLAMIPRNSWNLTIKTSVYTLYCNRNSIVSCFVDHVNRSSSIASIQSGQLEFLTSYCINVVQNFPQPLYINANKEIPMHLLFCSRRSYFITRKDDKSLN